MTGYKLTIEQHEQIVGQKFDGIQYFNPVPDHNGDFFIFEEEVVNCTEFEFVKTLTQTEYIP